MDGLAMALAPVCGRVTRGFDHQSFFFWFIGPGVLWGCPVVEVT